MVGRDPNEGHRSATPLELLYDLTLVVAFGVAGSQLAHLLAEGHLWPALAGFSFAMFAVVWPWINFTWFASAYDTDDWHVRIAVLVQMVGVLVLALGLPEMFHGLDDGWQIHVEVMVSGYVVMRVGMLSLWLRAAREDPSRRSTCLTYASSIAIAQVGWVAVAFAGLSLPATLTGIVVLLLWEMLTPYVAETRQKSTPWHPHHIAERYGLLMIIALGEGIIGTTASLEALIGHQGWSTDAVLVGAAGVSLTLGMWWIYFTIPFGELLTLKRDRAFGWGYGHIPVYAAIAAMGAGLHIAALLVEGDAVIGATGTMLAIAIPAGLFIVAVYAMYHYLLPGVDGFHLVLFALTMAVLVGAVGLAAADASIATCLIVVMLAPWVTVVGYETIGHRHVGERIAREYSS